MKLLGTTVVLGAALTLSGCAAGLVGSTDPAGEVRLLTDTLAPAPRVVLEAHPARQTNESQAESPKAPLVAHDESSDHLPTRSGQLSIDDVQAVEEPEPVTNPPYGAEPPGVAEHLASDVVPSAEESTAVEPAQFESEPEHIEAFASDEPALSLPQVSNARPATREPQVARQPTVTVEESPLTSDDAETIVTPEPAPRSPFRAGNDDGDQDRFTRQVVDVPIDLRPTEGEMPEDLAAVKFADEPTIDETFPSDLPPDVFCSHTPWTFCYRPLYFEDIKLERYGCNIGYAQTGLSGVRFFGSILALPYKMTVRPPRSCQCSNGFSRCGDCPLPGYGRREFRLDASLIEAAAVAGVVYILP